MYQQQFVEYKLRRSGIPALEYRVTGFDVTKPSQVEL